MKEDLNQYGKRMKKLGEGLGCIRASKLLRTEADVLMKRADRLIQKAERLLELADKKMGFLPVKK